MNYIVLDTIPEYANKSVPEVGMIFILFYPTPIYNLYKPQFLSI